MAGVDEEVEEDLFELDRVAEDFEVGCDLDAECDAVLAGVSGEDGEYFFDEFGDFDLSELGLSAGEAEHGGADAAGFFAASCGLGEGLFDQGHVGVAGAEGLEGVLGVAYDGGEEVVEFVGDDGCDGADGGEALCFGK